MTDGHIPRRVVSLRTARPSFGLAVAIACAVGGCRGHASLHAIPLDGRKISTTAPLIERVIPRECYYWLNDEGELCIAMRSFRASLLGRRLRKETIASFVLEGPPAGPARDYTVTRRTARVLAHAGLSHTRSASLGGILAVWDYGGSTLRGRFRFSAKQQTYSVLVGWSGSAKVLYVGEFKAVRNESAGDRIRNRTEAGGMERPPPSPNPTPVPAPPRQPTDSGQ